LLVYFVALKVTNCSPVKFLLALRALFVKDTWWRADLKAAASQDLFGETSGRF